MNLYKELKNIEPFEDVFYRKCFNYTRICVSNYFNKSILPILANDIFIYDSLENKINNYSLGLHVRCFSKYDEDNILKKMGINLHSKLTSCNVIDDIKSALDKDRPVILYVDNYYFPKETIPYGKKHTLHGFVIYGYDQRKQLFKIIEPWGFQTNQPLKLQAEYSIIEQAYHSVNKYIYSGNCNEKHTFFEYFLSDSHEARFKQDDRQTQCAIYRQNISENKEKIIEGLEKLKHMINQLTIALANREFIDDINNLEFIFKMMHIIATNKMAQKYCVYKLLGENNDVYNILDVIVSNWILLKVIIYKNIDNNFDEYIIQTIISKLWNIYFLEEKLYKFITLL